METMEPEAKRAYASWKNQRQRCYNSNNKDHPTYKNLTVDYTSRDFVSWWLHHQKRLKLKDPTCGRINHSKGYSFVNIKLEESIDNTFEVNQRVRYKYSNKILMTRDDGAKIIFFSLVSASKFMKIPTTTLRRRINEGKKVGCLFFEYIQQ